MKKKDDNLQVGKGASVAFYSDSQAGTIIKRARTTIEWQRDKARLISGAPTVHDGGFVGHFDNKQEYEFERDSNGITRKFSLRRNGQWVQVGNDMNTGCRLVAGRHEFYDRNF